MKEAKLCLARPFPLLSLSASIVAFRPHSDPGIRYSLHTSLHMFVFINC
jgi:hypothetical protein